MKTKTNVIILAQGEQKRLPNLVQPKQMLRLPACADTPILYRTLAQVSMLCPELAPHTWTTGTLVSVVSWLPLAEQIMRDTLPVAKNRAMSVEAATLLDPGNSSLKGLSRFLAARACESDRWERTVVLLGDVVYSWACLRALLDYQLDGCRFVGTRDLSESGGELWGITWKDGRPASGIDDCIRRALARHPSFQAYQPGQLRRILWETPIAGNRSEDPRINMVLAELAAYGATALPWYKAIDDYTRDIDVPKHLETIDTLSEAACADDKENGLVW